jgi:putative inorganic carbon (HCO3(-)) transporter
MGRFRPIACWISKYGFWIVLAMSPFLLFPNGGLPFLSMFVVGLIWISRRISSGRFGYLTNLDIPIVFLVFTLLMGYGVSINPDLSWTRMWNYLLGVLIFYTIVNAFKPGIHWQISVIFVALLTMGVVLYSMVGTDWSAVRLFQIPWLYDRFPSLLRNIPGSGVTPASDLKSPRTIGLTLSILLPFLITYLLFYSKGKLKLVLTITVLLGGIALLLTQTVEAFVGLCAGLFFIFIWRNRKAVYLLPVLFVCGMGLLLVLGVQKTLIYLLSADNPVGIAIILRLDMWSRAVAMIRDMPFTGIGVNIFSTIQSYFYPGFIIGSEPHAHNLYIQTALDQGLPGLGAMLFLFIAWVISVYRNYRTARFTGQRILYVALIAAIVSFLVQGFMDSMTLGAKTAPIIWAFLGMGVIPDVEKKAGNHLIPKRTVPWLRVVAPVTFMVVTIGGVLIVDPAAIQRNLGTLLAQQSLFTANYYSRTYKR